MFALNRQAVFAAVIQLHPLVDVVNTVAGFCNNAARCLVVELRADLVEHVGRHTNPVVFDVDLQPVCSDLRSTYDDDPATALVLDPVIQCVFN